MAYSLIINPDNLDGWLKDNFTCPSFALSYDWQEIARQEGRRAERLAVVDREKIVAVALAIYNPLPAGQKYAFCPQGPALLPTADPTAVFAALRGYFQKQHCLFFRVENQTTNPLTAAPDENIKKTRDINPPVTLRLNLAQSPDRILAAMRGKTRYNIRLAEKHGLVVKMEKNLPVWLALLQKTGTRDGFRLHSDAHYDKIIRSPLASQITIYRHDRPLAAGIFLGFGDTFTYLFGASDYAHRQLMAPYLMHWTAIKTAQAYGYRVYDFFGIAPPDAGPRHQYAGVTRFKTGFGGEISQTAGTYDFVICPLRYRLYQLARALNPRR